ncbi:9404_t:CDS:2 [Cetraspora pellucida]|uniref:9404_t:CDS:1 n=1 Tax=Cetraspora pellucida TaxID=1433469 RepID=A0ACA9M081_9GLOM|nr:9404_t:CDS:2 [Cetraspora pellucida]
MDTIFDITKQYFRTDLPALQIGDKVEITTKNFNKNEKSSKDEKTKYRLTHFKGTVIAQKNPGQIGYTFSVLKDSKGSDKDKQPTKTLPISPPVYPEEQDDCPYNEKSLTEISPDYSGMRADELEK